jgi:C-terminal processing protease CtpA/Prc
MVETYVFLDVAKQMDQHVRDKLQAGAYDSIATPEAFARQLTGDLRSVSGDLHLRVAVVARSELGSGGRLTDEQIERRNEQLRRENYRFRRLEVLDDNIGYLRLDNFVDAAIAGPTAVAAMNFLANVDALIVDLRENSGGAPSMIQLISSFLFEDRVHLNSFYVRQTDSWSHFWTQSDVDGPKLVDVPVFVLTSGRTFSAAEEFAYNLKHLERGTIVGETTRGGAHPQSSRRFDFGTFGVVFSVPFGRAVNPITGTNWEGTGVQPHISVPASEALEAALAEARAILGNEGRSSSSPSRG